jgi:ribosomal protein L16 Arg81 hydroxylase
MRGLLIALILVLSSCSLEHRMEKKFRRAERKIEKLTIRYPQLLKTDTINDTIQVTTEAIEVDTLFKAKDDDTVTIFKDRLRIQYYRQNDTVYISGTCAADTIYKTISIPYQQVVVRKETILEQIQKQSKRIIWFLVILAILYIAIRVIWKFIKPL